MNHRNRGLLDLAHELNECANCGRWSEAGSEPAHENGISAGKGQSIKSHDHRHAALCNACHRFYDSGTGTDPSGLYEGTREGKAAMWNRAYKRTYDEYFRRGYLKVSA